MKRKNRNSRKLPFGDYSPARQALIDRAPETLSIGLRVRRERYLRNLTLEQMASFLNISTSYLGSIERGARQLSAKMETLLHDMLGISYDFLREGHQVTGAMISQFVREPGDKDVSDIRHRIDVLLRVATEEELSACYSMIHSYMTTSRNKKKTQAPSEQKDSGSSPAKHLHASSKAPTVKPVAEEKRYTRKPPKELIASDVPLEGYRIHSSSKDSYIQDPDAPTSEEE